MKSAYAGAASTGLSVLTTDSTTLWTILGSSLARSESMRSLTAAGSARRIRYAAGGSTRTGSEPGRFSESVGVLP